MGISIGGSAVIAQHYGAGQYEDVSEATHTCMPVSYTHLDVYKRQTLVMLPSSSTNSIPR